MTKEMWIVGALGVAFISLLFVRHAVQKRKAIVHPTKLERLVGETLARPIMEGFTNTTGTNYQIGDTETHYVFQSLSGSQLRFTNHADLLAFSNDAFRIVQQYRHVIPDSDAQRVINELIEAGFSPDDAAEAYRITSQIARERRGNRQPLPGMRTNVDLKRFPLVGEE